MNRLILAVSLALTGVLASHCPATAADAALRRQHPWGCFAVGAWKTVRVQTETLDDEGRVSGTSVTETRTTLDKVDEQGVELLVETIIDVGGKRLAADPRRLVQGFYGEAPGQTVQSVAAGPGSVTIDGREIACDIRQVSLADAQQQITSQIYFSSALAPYVLRRETTARDAPVEGGGYDYTLEVLAVDMPYRLLSQLHPAALRKVTQTDSRGSTVTLEVVAADVPGGVVAHYAKSLDAQGRVISRSTLEVVGYGVSPEPPPDIGRRRLFRRYRAPYRW